MGSDMSVFRGPRYRNNETFHFIQMAREAFHVPGTKALFVSAKRLNSQAAFVRFLNCLDGIGFPHDSEGCVTTFPNGSTVKFEATEDLS